MLRRRCFGWGTMAATLLAYFVCVGFTIIERAMKAVDGAREKEVREKEERSFVYSVEKLCSYYYGRGLLLASLIPVLPLPSCLLVEEEKTTLSTSTKPERCLLLSSSSSERARRKEERGGRRERRRVEDKRVQRRRIVKRHRCIGDE